MEHLLTNNLLSNKQYGFVQGRSTVLQLLNMLDKWTEVLESSGQLYVIYIYICIYTDYEKHLIRFLISACLKKSNHLVFL